MQLITLEQGGSQVAGRRSVECGEAAKPNPAPRSAGPQPFKILTTKNTLIILLVKNTITDIKALKEKVKVMQVAREQVNTKQLKEIFSKDD